MRFYRVFARHLIALVLALSAVACVRAHVPEVAATEPVRVMTFNIRYGTAPDGAHAWPLRRGLAFSVIREFAPTVLGVQEALRFQLDDIGRQMPDYSEIGVARDDGHTRGEYSAILYDRRRLDVLEQGTFWLSDTPTVPGSMSWGNRYVRIATWARFHVRAARTSFYVFNTHWDHESQVARERSAALILERIARRSQPSDPVLLMGDFNAGEQNTAFRALLSNTGSGRLFDTFRVIHPDAREVGTYHAFRGDRSGEKVDAILASPEWRVLSADHVLRVENGLYPSDHFPVTAVLTFRTPAPAQSSNENRL